MAAVPKAISTPKASREKKQPAQATGISIVWSWKPLKVYDVPLNKHHETKHKMQEKQYPHSLPEKNILTVPAYCGIVVQEYNNKTEIAMSSFFSVSDAESLAMHAVIMMGSHEDRPVKIRDIAAEFKFSEAHLAKVLNRLLRAGIVTATRGPAGGYCLARPAGEITLFDVYRAIEGDGVSNPCMFRIPVCDGTGCSLEHFFDRISKEVENKLKQTRLSDISYHNTNKKTRQEREYHSKNHS